MEKSEQYCPHCNQELYLITTLQEISKYNPITQNWIIVDKIIKQIQYVCNNCLNAFDNGHN